MAFAVLRWVPSIKILVRVFNHLNILNSVICFCPSPTSNKNHIVCILHSFDVICHIYWLVYFETLLHASNTMHLVIVDALFYVLLNCTCSCLLRNSMYVKNTGFLPSLHPFCCLPGLEPGLLFPQPPVYWGHRDGPTWPDFSWAVIVYFWSQGSAGFIESGSIPSSDLWVFTFSWN